MTNGTDVEQGRFWGWLDKQVQVALARVFAARSGAKHPRVGGVMGRNDVAYFLAMCIQR